VKLLTELCTDVEYLEETQNDGKHLYISGVYLQGGIKNRNGRIYPPPLLDREATRYVKEMVDRKAAYGELGHPNSPGLNADKISHLITELKKDGDNWIGKARVINEGNGKIVRGIIEAGGAVGVSSRGMGSLKENKKLGANIVQDDFRLMVGADIVMNPSGPDCWVTSVYENVDWIYNAATESWQHEQIEDLSKELKRKSNRQLQEEKVKLFAHYMKIISGK
jgi:hypothetical protein